MKNLLNSNYKKSQVEIKKIQEDMFNLISELYPICRSITGNGVRQSLDIIKKHIEIEKKEVATGTQVFDWNIPKEWNISNAYIIDPNGKKIIDFKKSNLHVMSYSTPIKKKIELEELKKHIHTIPTQPNIIPYITSYYNENWGFCMSQNQFNELESGEYEICIDSTLKNGSLTYGEYLIKGEIQDEFLLSCYICHPSLCNDNLSGVALLTYLAKYLKNLKPKFSYRFLFIPETIGAITWLNLNEDKIDKIKGGLVATCLGDSGNSTYKKSRRGDSRIDKIVSYVLKHSNSEHSIVDFYPYGSDERQFCSPGFNLPMGSLMRTPYRKFLEYHNSGDNLEFIKKDSLGDSFSKYLESIWMFDKDEKFLNVNPKCEPQLGKRGIYRNTGIVRTDMNTDEIEQRELAIFWIMNFSDGKNSLLDISEKSGIPFDIIVSASSNLYENKLLKQLDDN
jgi:aminopeptidase-like protein